MSDFLRVAYRRALAAKDPSLVQLVFDVGVLERYRGEPAFSVIRTNTVARVKQQGGWTLDIGIGEGERTVHASWRDLADNVPDEEREHWAAFAVLDCSDMFLRMRLTPGSCFDDGDARPWE